MAKINEYRKKTTATTVKDTANTASKRVVQKTAETTGDFIGNKTANKITSLGKTKSKEKEDERQEIYIPPEKRQQIIDDWKLFWQHVKMEYRKITNLLDTTSDNVPRFITKKWVEAHDQSGSAEEPSKQIIFKTSMLWLDLCNFSDAYIVIKETITLTKINKRKITDIRSRFLAFKNNAPFTYCISKINNVLIDNAEDLDVAMPMYNLLEYSKNYRKTRGSLWKYCRDEPNNPLAADYNADPITILSLKYKSSITEKSIKWKSRGWWKHWARKYKDSEKSWNCGSIKTFKQFLEKFRQANPNADPLVEARERIDAPTSATLKITDTKLYVSVVTLWT